MGIDFQNTKVSEMKHIKPLESVNESDNINEMDFSFVGGEVATNTEAILAIVAVIFGTAGLAYSSFKSELKDAFKKKGKDREKAVKSALVNIKNEMKAAA